MTTALAIPKSAHFRLSLSTWLIVLLVSDLPNALIQAAGGEPPAWLFWAKIGLLAVSVLVSQVWKPIQPVRTFFLLLGVLMLALWGMNGLRGTPAYLQWEDRVSWVVAMAAYQLLKLAVVLVMSLVLLGLGRQRKDFFLTWGQLKTPIRARQAAPGKGSLTWGTLGLILGLCIAPLTLLVFGLGNLPTASVFTKALPYLPAALLFAATNAFAEEMQFRASLLHDLEKPLGESHAIWITAAFFGLAHYFGGAPAGIPGVLITGFLGALFAKCMLGSRGIGTPWFIHFCQNAVIYSFWAIGAVA